MDRRLVPGWARSAWIACGVLLLLAGGALQAQPAGGAGGAGGQASPAAGGVAASFRLSGAVQHERAIDLAALEALPATELKTEAGTYTGVTLWALLSAEGGLLLPPSPRNAAVLHYVLVSGSDGYGALFSLAEVDPAYGARPVLVAYRLNGAPLGRSGMARLVVPGDGKRSRAVANLASIQILPAR